MNMLLIILLFIPSMLQATTQTERHYSYLYPVDTIEYGNDEYMLTLWQKTADITELYFWDPKTGIANKELFSLFTPVGIQVLPSRKAYSFIDNGRVRIKELIKRSPASLEFDKPLYNISLIHWIDDNTAYCHAQEGHRLGIYLFDRNGRVRRILGDQSSDYLFPSRVDDTLFYIRRSYHEQQIHHAIGAVPFGQNVSYDDSTLYGDTEQELVIQAGTLPIAFLKMENAERGFVVAHQGVLDDSQKTVQFHYYAIEKTANKWQARQLFSFGVPSFLLSPNDENKLYENILPLLPYHNGTKIYYGSAHAGSHSMQMYCFDIAGNNKKRCRIAGNRSQLIFCPRLYSGTIMCGGSLVPGAQQFVPEVVCTKSEELTFNFVRLQ